MIEQDLLARVKSERALAVERARSTHIASSARTNAAAAASDATVRTWFQRVAAAHQTEITPAFIEKLSALIADFMSGGRGALRQ